MKSHLSSSLLALLGLSFAAGCGLENSVVGGQCRDGMVLSGNTCVAPGPGVTQISPTDPPVPPFGSVAGANTGGSGSHVGSSGVHPAENPPTVIEPVLPEPITSLPVQPINPIAPPELLPPVPPAHVDLVCAPSFVACHGVCIPSASDGANCGACGKICPSNICMNGECVGATPGDVVLIGHDYTSSEIGFAQTKVLMNALTIATTDPIRVLSYEEGASPHAVGRVKDVSAATLGKREIEFTVASAADGLTSATLSQQYDIVLIHEAGSADPVATGTSWSSSLGKFTKKGGIVIALDRGTSPMPQLLTSAGLLKVGSHTMLPDMTHLFVTSSSDVVGWQVLSPYAGFGSSVSFQGLDAQSSDLTWVVRAKTAGGAAGDAVVVHRSVRDE